MTIKFRKCRAGLPALVATLSLCAFLAACSDETAGPPSANGGVGASGNDGPESGGATNGAGAGTGGSSSSGGSGGQPSGEMGDGGSNPGSGGLGGASSGGAPPRGDEPPSFILGADITITLEDEYWGATYRDEGTEKALEAILHDRGFNFIRIDTFVNPSAPGGYAATKEQPFRDLDQTITLATRVKAQGMGFLLDLHMSDTWTNPSAQAPPAAWAQMGIAALETAVYDYVKGAVTQLIAAGARPDMVQIGNEITNGMLWNVGRIVNNDFTNLGRLLKAGIAGVRDVDESISIMLHIEKCNDLATSRWWLNGVLGQGVEFDILGQSCYAAAPNPDGSIHPGYQGTPAEWQTTFDALASEYPDLKFVIAEYSAEQRAANDVMFALPDGRGLGTFNWDPTRSYETHPNVPLFDTDGAWNRFVTIPELMSLYEQMATDYGLR